MNFRNPRRLSIGVIGGLACASIITTSLLAPTAGISVGRSLVEARPTTPAPEPTNPTNFNLKIAISLKSEREHLTLEEDSCAGSQHHDRLLVNLSRMVLCMVSSVRHEHDPVHKPP